MGLEGAADSFDSEVGFCELLQIGIEKQAAIINGTGIFETILMLFS